MREPYEFNLADGTKLSLTFPFKSIKYFERLTGGHFFSDSANAIGLEYVCAGIAAGLLAGGKKLSLDEAADIIEKHLDAGGEMPFILRELMNALRQWGIMHKDEEATAQPARPTKDEDRTE